MIFALAAFGSTGISAIKHSAYKSDAVLDGHIFWHSIITAMHNNPNRTEVFGTQKTPELDPRGDGLSFYLFDQYLAKNGLKRENFTSNNGERDRLAGIDVIWGKYDRILGRVFWDSLVQNPLYVISSFIYYQPKEIINALVRIISTNSAIFVAPIIFIPSVLTMLIWPMRRAKLLIKALTPVLVFSFVPAMVVAAYELRVMESLTMLIVIFLFLGSWGCARIMENPSWNRSS